MVIYASFSLGPKKSIDPSQRKKLETDYKRKLKVTQRKMKEVKESETATTQMFQYHKNYEQRLKDMEGQLARARNHYGDVNRQLKLETDRKTKFEQVSILSRKFIYAYGRAGGVGRVARPVGKPTDLARLPPTTMPFAGIFSTTELSVNRGQGD